MHQAGLQRTLQSGFTLLELMVVLLVIGIMAGLTVMSVGGNPEREFRRDVARLQQVLIMSADEAPFVGEELGFWVSPDGKSYSFYRFDEEELEWLAYEKEAFKQRPLSGQYKLEIELLGDPVDLAELHKKIFKLSDKLEGFDEEPLVPWLVFFSDGQYTPFRLWLSNSQVKSHVYALEGNGLGKIKVKQVDAREKPDTSHE
jgi:general secretion pathway protein H